MKTVKELKEEQRSLHKQLAEARMAERRAVAAQGREEARAEMTPEHSAAEAEKDRLYGELFNSQLGEAVLNDLFISRPIIVDGIRERVARAKAAKSSGSEHK